MKNIFKKLAMEAQNLSWTLAGTGLVLITLSGSIKKTGIIISLVALAVHLLGIMLSDNND